MHVMLSMWRVFQETPEILHPESEARHHAIDDDLEAEFLLTDADMCAPGGDIGEVQQITEYLHNKKKIPTPEEMDYTLKNKEDVEKVVAVEMVW